MVLPIVRDFSLSHFLGMIYIIVLFLLVSSDTPKATFIVYIVYIEYIEGKQTA